MPKLINKKTVVVINKLSIEMTGGESFQGKNNIVAGQSLGFVEEIKYNKHFGKVTYPTIYHMAAAYMVHIIKNHTFVDGNKRTGLATAITFLDWNKIYFAPFDEENVFSKVFEFTVSDKSTSELIPEVADWLESMSLE
jgi:death-on-curing protein